MLNNIAGTRQRTLEKIRSDILLSRDGWESESSWLSHKTSHISRRNKRRNNGRDGAVEPTPSGTCHAVRKLRSAAIIFVCERALTAEAKDLLPSLRNTAPNKSIRSLRNRRPFAPFNNEPIRWNKKRISLS